MQTDRYGLALSSASPEAATAYREAVDLLLSAYPGADERLRAAVAHDEAFALPHAALARYHQIYSRTAQARSAIARARELVSSATPRERGHVQILGLAIDGEPAKALEALLTHLEEFPRDALPLSLALGAFGLYAFSGRVDHDAARLALCRKLAPHYGEDWWFLTHLGWSHTEAGKLAAGGRLTARALELRGENAHGAHAYAHFFAEADEGEDGMDFVEGWLPGYEREAPLYGHIRWHCALWRLQDEDLDGAMELYQDTLRPSQNPAPPVNVISDSTSLLWRIALDAPVDWREVQAYAKAHFPAAAPHFVEWHLAMAAAGAGDFEALERRLAALSAPPPGPVLRDVCSALGSFAKNDYAKVVALLEPRIAEFSRLGGSGAQRALLADTLDAARRRLRA
jgi:hypothetical protein